MKVMAEKDKYHCMLLEEGDLDILHKAKLLCFGDKDEADTAVDGISNLTGILNAATESGAEYWKELFEEQGSAFFVLFEDENIIGTTNLHISDSRAELASSHILHSHRGRGLSRLLYDARMQYIRESTNCTEIITDIQDNNPASIAAAQRNGFREKKHYQKNGQPACTYSLEL